MGKFNSIVLTAADGTQVHFVTRGRSKAPDMSEVVEYMNENNIVLMDTEADARAKEDALKNWRPSNNKVFLTDLRSGLIFCSQKYGVPEAVIETYVRNVAPHLNANFLTRSKNNAR